MAAKLIRALGWKVPLKVVIEEKGGRIYVRPATARDQERIWSQKPFRSRKNTKP